MAMAKRCQDCRALRPAAAVMVAGLRRRLGLEVQA